MVGPRLEKALVDAARDGGDDDGNDNDNGGGDGELANDEEEGGEGGELGGQPTRELFSLIRNRTPKIKLTLHPTEGPASPVPFGSVNVLCPKGATVLHFWVKWTGNIAPAGCFNHSPVQRHFLPRLLLDAVVTSPPRSLVLVFTEPAPLLLRVSTGFINSQVGIRRRRDFAMLLIGIPYLTVRILPDLLREDDILQKNKVCDAKGGRVIIL